MTPGSDRDAGTPRDSDPDPFDLGTVPKHGRLLGLDYGTRRIGVAVSTDEQTISSPLENYTRQTPELDALRLSAIATDYEAVGIVVGLPVHMSGDEGGKAREARLFGAWVHDVTGLPVCFWDERFTSAQADEILRSATVSRKKRKAFRDKLAAHILLQSFLDSTNRRQRPGAM